VNPRLQSLQPYPFEKLRSLFEGVKPNPGLAHISLGIGEPQHSTPDLIKRALSGSLAKLASYPPTAGGDPLRQAIADWLVLRYGLRSIDSKTEVLRSTARARRCSPLRRPSSTRNAAMPWWFAQSLLSDLRGCGAARRSGARSTAPITVVE